jgi:NitT/TauT family transport system ATP-binding protein
MSLVEGHRRPEFQVSSCQQSQQFSSLIEPSGSGYLRVQNLSKEYILKTGKKLWAIEDVSFELNQNQIGVLLGPSGCGKSTILRMIAGLDIPTRGSFTLAGHSVKKPGRDRGMVFQQYTSFPWLTVQENVEYGLKLQGCPRSQRRQIADHFIEKVRLTQFRHAYPSQLSGGMQQRVAIARTLANQPEIVLMDEPFAALDAETRWQMQELLLTLVQEERLTVVLVTHDIDEALFLGDQIIFLSSHPGTVRQRFYPVWQQSGATRCKEDLHGTQAYIDMEKQLMQLMRQEAGVVGHA